jgi:hypothetical protein
MVWFIIFLYTQKLKKYLCMYFLDLIISLLNPWELDQYFKNSKYFFFFGINGQHFDINTGPTSRLIFKYKKLTKRFS